MPKRDRFAELAPWVGFIICLCIIAAISFWHAYSKGYQTANEENQASSKADDVGQKVYEECARVATVKEALACYGKAEKASREDRRAEQDLNAQREMADWAEAMLVATSIIGALSIAVTGVGIYYVRQTLVANTAAVDQAREANRITRETDRAWLQLVIEMQPGRVIDGHLHITYFVRAKNVGNKPAIKAITAFENLSSRDSREHHEGSTRRLLEQVGRTGPEFGVTFPDQTTTGMGFPIVIPLDQIPNYYPRVNAVVMYEVAGSREKKYTLDGFDICGVWNGNGLGIGNSLVEIRDGMELRATRTGFGLAT